MNRLSHISVLAAAVSLVLSGNVYAGGQIEAAGNITSASVVEQTDPQDPMQAQIISFEGKAVPDYVKVADGSTVAVTDRRAVNGEQSLVWQWQPDAPLTLDTEFRYYTPKEAYQAYGRQSSTVFSVWIYNEKPSEGELEFQFGSAANSRFTMKLDFTGWRSPGLAFHRDMQGMPASTLKGLTITPKGMTEGGELYIDRVMVSIDDIRYQWSDDVVTTRITVPEVDYGLPEILPDVTAEELAAVDTIKQELLDYYVGDMKASKKALDAIRKEYRTYGLSKENGVINGVHIVTKKQLTIYQKAHLSPDDKARVKAYVDLRKFSELMEKIARVWHVTDDPVVRAEMRDKYILMSEHLLDQGFQHGSSLVATHHWGYGTRSWYSSVLLMEQSLKDAGLLEPIHSALLWYSREFKERGFDMEVGPKSSDMDYYNTLARAHMIMLLLEPDEQQRVALMHKFGKFISGNMAQTPPGYADGFRPDGTAFRHKGNYPGYSFAAFNSAAHVAYLLRGTPYELSEPARQYLKKVMLAARVYSNPNPGVGTNGRRPFFGISLNKIADGYRWLALAGTEQGTADTDLAQAYLRISGDDPQRFAGEFGQLVMPEAHPQGAYSFNYAAMGIHRYDDKMVTMKGWNRYVWSSEIYNNANRYGRYQSHGSVQIQKWGDEKEYGFSQEGWDWNRMPGATTIHLPWELLDAPRKHTTMLTNNVRFNGSTELEGRYGAFGFTLENPDRWPAFIDPSFRAKKSVFSFDNRLVLVGSNIANSRSEYSTETTLFQYGLTDKTQSLIINGEAVTAFPFSTELEPGDWLIDGMGNGYYVAKGGSIEVRRQHQESRDNITKEPTFGNMVSAWINHGNAPSGAEYEYMIMLDATPEKMQALAASMVSAEEKPYQVLRKDGTAHIVHDRQSGVTGYTAYQFVRTSDKWIRAISTSSVVMAKEQDGILSLSVANPDLNMEKNTLSREVPVAITLKGRWRPAEADERIAVKHKGSKTVVTFRCKDGLPIQTRLQKI
ncbi:chondroitinase family polysaccharide lyase [Photobacterium sp. DA100]|uniref:chondroitinase family polysaccharide lyase n=1 Tax=Photobacterium sp. DA100 TaxID=3027472 RepID=UPI002478FAD0|nr:chondroitinase family polysaccharide lyase [Photobacterium sp. DA100]WEM43655.1 chondroitinase family polysaccharide lyase [Photobacterium sp. DA100]